MQNVIPVADVYVLYVLRAGWSQLHSGVYGLISLVTKLDHILKLSQLMNAQPHARLFAS